MSTLPSDPTTDDLLRDAAERAISYLAGLDGRSVAPAAEALERLRELNEPFPEEPSSPAATLALLDEVGSPATVASAGSRFFGFVIGGTLPAALAANWLAGAWDQHAGLEVASPVAAALERACLRWLRELFSLPQGSAAGFVTGATMANFTGLAAARHALLARRGWDAEARGSSARRRSMSWLAMKSTSASSRPWGDARAGPRACAAGPCERTRPHEE